MSKPAKQDTPIEEEVAEQKGDPRREEINLHVDHLYNVRFSNRVGQDQYQLRNG